MDELKEKLVSLGKVVDEANCRMLFATYDVNKSGALEFEEFIPLMDQLVARELNL
jgi:Ca2+-binding EF-hand superfamily protein